MMSFMIETGLENSENIELAPTKRYDLLRNEDFVPLRGGIGK